MKFRKAVTAVVLICALVCSAAAVYLIPGGGTIGVKAYSDGLLVTAVEPDSAASQAGLRQGDVLQRINGERLESPDQLLEIMEENEPMELEIRRRSEVRRISVTPEKTDKGCSLGAYVRSAVAGIGTVTYYDSDRNSFGALGHGITDASGDNLLPITGGIVVPSYVVGVVPGTRGTAGQLKGEFDASVELGSVTANTERGIFGTMEPPSAMPYPVASAEEVTPGKATIRTNIQGTEIEEYEIEILRLHPGGTGRDMLLRVTDPELLKKTGGIVQGMSGSPILQNGKLVGAVTHVLVNDPTSGYGIFLEKMLEEADELRP